MAKNYQRLSQYKTDVKRDISRLEKRLLKYAIIRVLPTLTLLILTIVAFIVLKPDWFFSLFGGD